MVRLVMKLAVKYYLRFGDEHPSSLPAPKQGKKYFLYIHIPFCTSLCPFCSFHRFKLHEETARKYFELLRKEMRMAAELGYDFDSAYFGGGTTTILPDELEKTIQLAKELFSIREISCEADPDHVNLQSITKAKGIDRLSIGVQTFNNKHLEHIGRLKKFGRGEEQYEKIKEALEHFDLVNIDMIYNFPGQTMEELLEDVAKVRSLNPPQITFYPLMYAPFTGKSLQASIGKPSHESEAEFYTALTQQMTEPYTQRTSWTFEKEAQGMIDEYVINNDEYVGIGSGAFSFLDGVLYANSFSLKEYAEKVGSGQSSISKSTRFGSMSIKKYRMMIEMFGFNGWPKNRPFIEYNALKLLGAVKGKGENAEVTPRGKFLLSVMMKCFYNGMDYIREEMRKDLKTDDERII